MHIAMPYFSTKKALRLAIEAGRRIRFATESPFEDSYDTETLAEGQTLVLVGPGPYERKWYGQVTRKGGKVKVR